MRTKISTYYGEPDHWSGAYGSRPNPAPVYGKVLDRNGDPLELDSEVLVWVGHGAVVPYRGKVVAIGDEGSPGSNIVRTRQHCSAYLRSASSDRCLPMAFDEEKWLQAETAAATFMGETRGVDLARCQFGGFWFEEYQRQVTKRYLGSIAFVWEARA